MLTPTQALAVIIKLHPAAQEMAKVIESIRLEMEGKGISPARAPVVIMRLLEVESKLRQLGADQNNPIPWIPL